MLALETAGTRVEGEEEKEGEEKEAMGKAVQRRKAAGTFGAQEVTEVGMTLASWPRQYYGIIIVEAAQGFPTPGVCKFQ